MNNSDFNLEIWKKFSQHPKLGEILIQHKRITLDQLGIAINTQKTENLPIGEILVRMGAITKNELIEVLELQTNIDKMLDNALTELKKLKGNEE